MMNIRTVRSVAVVLLVIVTGNVGLVAQPGESLRIEVEGRSIESQVEVDFYGDRVPRDYFVGIDPVSERVFFDVAGDADAARRSRNHRAVSVALGTVSMMAFFAGLVLFGAADEVDFTLAGMSRDTDGRAVSASLLGGSVVAGLTLAFRRDSWAPLSYAFATMTEHNER